MAGPGRRLSQRSPVRRLPTPSALPFSRCFQVGHPGEGVGLPGGQRPGRFSAAGAPPHPQLQGTAARRRVWAAFFFLPSSLGAPPGSGAPQPGPVPSSPVCSPPVAAALGQAAVNGAFLRVVGGGVGGQSSEKHPNTRVIYSE